VSWATFFAGLSSAAAVTDTVSALVRNTRGTRRSLLLEVQRNINLLYLFIEDEAKQAVVINKLETRCYDEAIKSNFDFARIKRGKVSKRVVGDIAQFQSYVGWTTEQLFENIYLKIHALKSIVEIDPKNRRFRVSVRLKNLLKMMLLLLKHVKD
jgi:hypothetical protein